MKPLILLLLLDYSGSMYQKFEGKFKFKVVQENVDALASSLFSPGTDTDVGMIVFGLDQKKKCADISYEEPKAHGLVMKVRSLRPGNLSKTPLADAIQKATDITIERKAKKVVVFSDGADTCGRDPCAQLLESNEQLKKVDFVMEMTFIGIDLKEDERKFECFKTLNLSHLKINYMNSKSSFEAQEILKGEEEIADLENPYGLVEVKGAPAGIEFRARSIASRKKKEEVWKGAYQRRLVADSYEIVSSDQRTRKIQRTLEVGQRLELHWADFFRRPFAELALQGLRLTLLLTPTEQTKAIHRSVEPIILHGEKGKGISLKQPIPFGSWVVEIISPAWIKRRTGKKTEIYDVASKNVLDWESEFSVVWVKVPDPNLRWVFEIEKGEKYYLPDRFSEIPITTETQVNWLKSAPATGLFAPPTRGLPEN